MTHGAQPAALDGKAILVVEDEFFQAQDLADALTRAGARLVGPFPSLSAAVEALEAGVRVDAAVLDINLRGRVVYGVADALAARGIPFLFATGYDPAFLAPAHQGRPVCRKPVALPKMLGVLAGLCGAAGPAESGGRRGAPVPG